MGVLMFRKLLLATALITAPALADETKPFDIYGLSTANTYSGEMIVGGKKCVLKGAGEETCSRFGGARIGTTLIMNLTSKFNDGKFYAVSGGTYITFAADLRAAFTTKYGEPTVVEHAQWQNQVGATFDNEICRWVFADGVLTLRARGESRDSTEFMFIAKHNVPARFNEQQPVNF